MRYFVTLGDRTVEVDLSGPTPVVDGVPVADAELATLPGTPVRHLLAEGRSYEMTAQPGDRRGRWRIGLGGARFEVDAVDERTRAIREMTGGDDVEAAKSVNAPMPGLVVRLLVEPGEVVRAGQGLVVVEAMKMENELKAPADGTVARIEVQPGQTVNKGATLVVLD
jgi:biotin carboxyl carrier protein